MPRRPTRIVRRKRKAPKAKGRMRRKGFQPKRRGAAVKRYQSVNGVVNQSMVSMLNHKATAEIKALERVGSPNTFLSNYGVMINASPGVQNSYSFAHLSQLQLQRIRNQIPPASSSAPSRFILETYQSELVMTNTSTATVEIELYDITLKRDLAHESTYTTTGVGYTYPLSAQPGSYWAVGSLAAANLQYSSPLGQWPSNQISGSPFDSQLFRDYFVVKKRTRVLLTQGGSHRHFVMVKLNKLIDDALIQNEGVAAYAAISGFTMVVAKGLPNTHTTTPIEATTNAVQLACIQSQRLKYSYVLDNANNLYQIVGIPQPTSTQVLNIGSGQVDSAVAFTG